MRLQKYRRLVRTLFLLSLTGLLVCSYFYLRDQIPDHIFVDEGQDVPVLFHSPYNTFIEEETVEADSQNVSDIPRDNLHLSGTVEVETSKRQVINAGGSPVGIYIKTNGILVIGTGQVSGLDGQTYEPAEHIVKTGDYIIGANGQLLDSKEELVECINASGGREMNLEVVREGNMLQLAVTPIQTQALEYKAGIWVRNDAQGVGTLTYTDENGNFGALGHGISDVDTSTLLSLKEGKLYEADVVSVTKGQKGEPGELAGVIHYRDSCVLGTITENLSTGIYGTVQSSSLTEETNAYEIAYKQEVEKGPATVLCSVDGKVTEYEIEIESVEMNKKEINKGMVIRVTDQELLEKTGGIVQGMSGSPIIQNGRIVGAVTHVFVNDPTKGYGIFIENMLEH